MGRADIQRTLVTAAARISSKFEFMRVHPLQLWYIMRYLQCEAYPDNLTVPVTVGLKKLLKDERAGEGVAFEV